MFVGQRTQSINALRGHLAEYGLVAPQGRANVKRLEGILEDECSSLPLAVRDLAQFYLEQINDLDTRIADLDRKIRTVARQTGMSRLQGRQGCQQCPVAWCNSRR